MKGFPRKQLVDRLWEKAEPMAFIPKKDFVKALKNWDIRPIVEDGVLIAIVGEDGPHMHFETTGSGKPIPRRVVIDILQRIIDRHGYAVTKTPKEEERQHRFNRLIGFEVTGEDEYDVHYKITQVRRRLHS